MWNNAATIGLGSQKTVTDRCRFYTNEPRVCVRVYEGAAVCIGRSEFKCSHVVVLAHTHSIQGKALAHTNTKGVDMNYLYQQPRGASATTMKAGLIFFLWLTTIIFEFQWTLRGGLLS